MCASFLLWSFFSRLLAASARIEMNEKKTESQRREKRTYQHQIIASVVANQQQEKYENIKGKQKKHEKWKKKKILQEYVWKATEKQQLNMEQEATCKKNRTKSKRNFSCTRVHGHVFLCGAHFSSLFISTRCRLMIRVWYMCFWISELCESFVRIPHTNTYLDFIHSSVQMVR